MCLVIQHSSSPNWSTTIRLHGVISARQTQRSFLCQVTWPLRCYKSRGYRYTVLSRPLYLPIMSTPTVELSPTAADAIRTTKSVLYYTHPKNIGAVQVPDMTWSDLLSAAAFIVRFLFHFFAKLHPDRARILEQLGLEGPDCLVAALSSRCPRRGFQPAEGYQGLCPVVFQRHRGAQPYRAQGPRCYGLRYSSQPRGFHSSFPRNF